MQLAAELEPVEVKPGAAICMLTATLVSRDNKYTLKVLAGRVMYSLKHLPLPFSK